MEGYFSVSVYAEMTGISKDTAWHRVLRGSVPSVKDADGRWFAYYCDRPKPDPERYVKLTDWCRINGIPSTTVRSRCNTGKIREPNVVRYRPAGKQYVWYILKDYEFIPRDLLPKTNLKRYRSPDGYMQQKEFAELYRVSYNTVRQYVRLRKIPSVRIGKRIYIPCDAPGLSVRRYIRKGDT